MGYANGRITAPVNTDDISAVIGENNHDIGTLCCSAKINMWAKYKPERTGNYEDLTLDQRKQNNFGLRPGAVYSGKTAFINAVKDGSFASGWIYDHVTASDYQRENDFDGYNHNALCPFGSMQEFTGILYQDTFRDLLVPCEAPQAIEPRGDDQGMLSISDFDSYGSGGMVYKDCYFGILLYSAARQFMATADSPIGQTNDWQVNFGWINPSHKGSYTGIPFLSTTPFAVGGVEPSGTKICDIGQSGVAVHLISETELYSISLEVYYPNADSNVCEYHISISNNTGTQHTFGNLEIFVARDQNGTNTTRLVQFGNVTVAAGGSFERSGSVNMSQGWEYYQWFRFGYTGHTGDWEPMPAPDVDIDNPTDY